MKVMTEANNYRKSTSMFLKNKILKIVPKWSSVARLIALLLLSLLVWAIGYSLFKETVGVKSQLFGLAILFIVSKIIGCLVGIIKIPPLVGMLLTGVLLRNVGFLQISGGYLRFTAILRQLALVNILLPAGLGLNASALKKMSLMILNLAIIPVAVEVAGVSIMSYFLLQLPWLWGILLGLLLAAVSPAVIIPCLFELQDNGYGVNKGIHTLVIAAATFNDIICIGLFGIILGIIFSTGSLTMQILQGPIVLAIGFGYGIAWGLVCQYIPYQKEEYLVTLRTLLLGLGCILSAVGSEAIGYGGAGALGCIVSAFVASLRWRKQGWDTNNGVRANFVVLWKFFEPISFGLIGMEVNFDILESYTVLWGTITMTMPLVFRLITSFVSTQCSNLNLKENIFVAISWIPKATVQAALGPAALDLARANEDPIAEGYANTVLIISVISILITSPIGAILIMKLGPRLLHRTKSADEVDRAGIPNITLDVEESGRLSNEYGTFAS